MLTKILGNTDKGVVSKKEDALKDEISEVK